MLDHRDRLRPGRTSLVPRRRQRLGLLSVSVSVLVSAAMSAACSGDGRDAGPSGGQGDPVAVTASPTVTDLNEATLPLDAYTPTADQYSDLDYATKLLASACMRRFGINWNPGPRLDMGFLRSRSFGLVDADRAAAYGYHPTPEERASQDNSGDTGAAGLTPEQATILGGVAPGEPARPNVPEGGCYGEARRTLGWNLDSFMWLQELAGEATTRTLSHPRTQAANSRWSECMKAAGYVYASPEEANNDPAWWQDETAGPSPQEINTAVADVRCKTDTNYTGEVTAVLEANQQRLVDENFERLAATRAETDEALRKAADILANPPA